MRYRPFFISALTALVLSLVLPATAKADPQCPAAGTGPLAQADSKPLDEPAGYDPGLLGPATLPAGAVGKMLSGYNRFGVPPMDPKAYLEKYYQNSSWLFPTNFGFDPDQPPKQVTMQAGQKVDRFGSPYGTFLAVEKDTPFAARGLPPQSLNTKSGETDANYHVYCVLKDLKGVMYGKIAPAVGQPGGGYQYVLGNARVMDLVNAKQIVEVAP